MCLGTNDCDRACQSDALRQFAVVFPCSSCHLMVVGFFESLAALVVVDHSLNPLLRLEVVANAHAERTIFAAVPWGEPNLYSHRSANRSEGVGRSVLDLPFMILDPLRIPQGVDKRTAVAIGEDDLAREGRAVGVLC